MADDLTARFTPLVGTWTGVNHLFMDPTGPPDDSPCPSTFRLTLGGKVAVHEYEWSHSGEAQEGMAMLSGGADHFQLAWSDTFHTSGSIMFLEGEPGQKEIDVRGTYDVPDSKQPWGWRIQYARRESGLVVKMWNITPDGEEQRAVEIS